MHHIISVPWGTAMVESNTDPGQAEVLDSDEQLGTAFVKQSWVRKHHMIIMKLPLYHR